MEGRFYYTNDGKDVRGPFDCETILNLLSEGKLVTETQICREGTENWVSLNEFINEANADANAEINEQMEKAVEEFKGNMKGVKTQFQIGCALLFLLVGLYLIFTFLG